MPSSAIPAKQQGKVAKLYESWTTRNFTPQSTWMDNRLNQSLIDLKCKIGFEPNEIYFGIVNQPANNWLHNSTD